MGTSQVLKELAAQLSDSFTDSLVDQHLSSWRRSRIYDTTSVQKPKTSYYYQLQTLPGRSTSSCDTDDIITCMAGFLVSSICNCMQTSCVVVGSEFWKGSGTNLPWVVQAARHETGNDGVGHTKMIWRHAWDGPAPAAAPFSAFYLWTTSVLVQCSSTTAAALSSPTVSVRSYCLAPASPSKFSLIYHW
jgi:hypothetical protein